MVDLIEIGIVVDSKPVNNLVTALGKASKAADLADKNFRSLEKALKQGIGGGADNLLKAFSRLERAGMSLSDVNKGLVQDAKMLAQANQKQVNSLLNVDKATKSARNSAQAMKEAFREQDRAAVIAATATKANTAALNSFRMQNDAVYKSEQKLLNLKKLLRAEVANNNMTMREAAAVQMQYKKSLDTMGGGLTQTRSKMNGNNMAIQQLGYQFGDFAVQVQGGTSAFVAFSQQGAQLAGMLPMIAGPLGLSMGAAVGLSAALGVLIPIGSAVGRMFFEMRDDAEGAAASFDKVSESLDTIESIDISQFGKEFLGIAKEIRYEFEGILGVIHEVAMFDLKKNLAKPFEDLIKQLTDFEAASSIAAQTSLEPLDFNILGLDSMNEALFVAQQLKTLNGETKEELIQQVAAIEEALELRGLESMEVKRLLAQISEEIGLVEAVNDAIETAVDTAEELTKETAEAKAEAKSLADAFEDAARKARDVAKAVNDFYTTMRTQSIDLSGLEAELAVLEAGGKKAEAAAAGAGVALRASLMTDPLNQAILSTGSAGEVATQLKLINDQVKAAERIEIVKGRIIDLNKENTKSSSSSASASKKSADALKKETEAFEKKAHELNMSADAFAKYNDEYQKLVDLQKHGLSDKGFDEAVAKLNEELGNSLPLINDVATAFGDFMSRGFNDFKSFAASIGNSFKKLLIDMAMNALKSKILIPLATGMSAGFAGTAASAAGSAAGGATAGAATGGMMAGIGATVGTAGAALVGGGMSAFGMTAAAGGSVAAGMAAMPAMAAIGAVAAPLLAVAAVFSFFKKKTKELDSGINVTVKNMDTFVESFSKVQTSKFWGMSKSESTTTSAASDAVANPIIAAVSEIQNQVVKAADALGIASDAFEGFSYDFKLSLKGLTEEQAMAKINEELVKMGDSFASMTGLFSTMNELLAVTQQRMDLETKLLNMQGNVVELRKQELDAVHILNKGLAARIQLLEAEADMSSALAAFASGISQQQGVIKSAVDALISPLLEAINRVKTQAEASYKIFSEAADKTRVEAKTIVDLLRGALDARAIKSEGLELMRYKQAQRQLAAFAGGASFDQASLSKATEGVSIDSQKFFGSFEDYARDFYKTQVNLEQLEKKASEQLTDVEKQIELAEKAYETAMGTYEEAVETNVALKTLLEDLAAYTEVAARNEPFIDQIKAEGDRQVELLDQILKETTLQVNGLLGIGTSVADLVGSNLSVGEALSVLGLSGKELAGAVLALDSPVAEIGSHIKDLDLTLGGTLDRLGLTFGDLIDSQVNAFGVNVKAFRDAVGGNITGFSNAVGSKVDKFGNTVGGNITSFSGAVGGKIDNFSGAVGGKITGFSNAVGGKIDKFGNTVGGNITSFSGAVGGKIDNFSGAVGGKITGFGTVVGDNITSLGGVFTSGYSSLGLVSDGLKLGLVGVNGTIGGLGTNVTGLGTNVTGLGTNIAGLGTSTNTLGININNLGGSIGAALNGLGSTVGSLSGGFNGLVNSNNNLIAAIKAAADAAAASAGAAAGAGGGGAVAGPKTITIVSTFGGGLGGESGVVLSDGRTFKTGKGWGNAAEIRNAKEMARKAILKDGNVPGFANGGMHSGGMRLVGENGPELEATGPSRIYSAQQTKGLMSGNGSSETVAELRMLRQEISEMKAEQRKIGVENVKYNKKSYDLNRQWDVVGLPATRAS